MLLQVSIVENSDMGLVNGNNEKTSDADLEKEDFFFGKKCSDMYAPGKK